MLTSAFGKVMTYFGMGIMALMMFFFVYTYIPETSGKSLDECVEMFRQGAHKKEQKMIKFRTL